MTMGEFERRQLETPLKQMLELEDRFITAVGIARRNSYGGLWLIGGTVFRRLALIRNGTPVPDGCDFDLIVGDMKSTLYVPSGWSVEANRFGNPKFLGPDGIEIDFCPLEKVHSIVRRKVEPTMENWATGTPLTVQAVAFDCDKIELTGDIGIQAAYDMQV